MPPVIGKEKLSRDDLFAYSATGVFYETDSFQSGLSVFVVFIMCASDIFLG